MTSASHSKTSLQATPSDLNGYEEISSRPTSLLEHFRQLFSSGPTLLAFVILLLIVAIAIFAPLLGTTDPLALDPAQRLSHASSVHWFGTDAFGRDVYSRVVYGSRVSLIVGLGAAMTAVVAGLFIGVIVGYFPWVDAIIMRLMDGIMAIPGVLLAIALVSLSGASLVTVMVAITIPEIPRVVRLVRGTILTVRHEPYVEAALTLGTSLPVLLWRHLVPAATAPLIVQGTYVFASAILTEAILSFLGAGLPPETSSWGNIMAEGRMYFQLSPSLILYPGLFLSLTVLSVNVLGDALRDALDPRMARRLK
ncbi:ABC transporter permease [Allopusillimonas ginsengisoli]|uniref:ABC transporter permease n=1 Tax=Allopusillimonas ginsengisoli TaxID=453575 RepID=UPI00101EFF9C|nr:ABC transporter permease [Allopusillimonas ginsengisoli]TEA79022.1 ABC transporter permease [Allopusillimonas ginsengisoli]